MNKSNIIRLYALFILLGVFTGGYAQSSTTDYRAIYKQAESEYFIGRFEQADSLLSNNLGKFPNDLLQSVYRLLALTNMAVDRDDLAEKYTRLLLADNPYYTPTLDDYQRFTDMVENIKRGMSATITTASSQAEQLSEVPVPITLITEEMIHDSGARNLQEVLATYVPGMNIIDCNDDINISMRGIYGNGQEKILVMLNGHRLNSYSTNIASPDFSIGLEKLKQIEVLRGPASSLYGNVALTAVVNLITKSGADVDGVRLSAGVGNYRQLRGNILFGKRFFDLDILLWANLYKSAGQDFFIPKEETGLGQSYGSDGYATVGAIGNKPSYEFGSSLRYKKLQFLYTSQFSQVQAPLSMSFLFGPYNHDSYKTFNGVGPSFTTSSHHAHLSLQHQFDNVFLRGTVSYDNSDMTHYQAISDQKLPGFIELLPIDDAALEQLKANDHGGYSRYVSGQEHTFGIKLQGDWSYMNNQHHKGLLSFGAEYSYFKLDDTRYVFGYNFKLTLPENNIVSDLGKAHENSANGYIQLKHQWRSLILNAGLRFDYKFRYDSTTIREFSPRVALIYAQPKWNVKLSYSKAFIDAPFFYRKSNLFLTAFEGLNLKELTANIDPETLHSYQLTFGATQWVKGLNFEVNAFYNHAKNLIVPNLLEHLNGSNSDLYGLEFSGRYTTRRFTANLIATWLATRKFEVFDNEYPHPFNTPKFSVNSVLAWKLTDRLRLHANIAFCDKQTTQFANIVNYMLLYKYNEVYLTLMEKYWNTATQSIDFDKMTPSELQEFNTAYENIEKLSKETTVTKDINPYFTVNVGADYQIGKLGLALNIHNLFNRKYSLSGVNTGLIPQRGRWFLFDISYKF